MRTRYIITEKEKIFFITSTIVKWIPVFISSEYFGRLFDNYNRQDNLNGSKASNTIAFPNAIWERVR